MGWEQGSGRGRRETRRHRGHREACPGHTKEMREIPYPKQQDLALRLCTFAFISSLSFELASNLEECIEDRFADVVEFRLKMIDEFMQPVIHDLFDV